MAESTVLCPHCETHVEIQVAAVTRTRTCPKCGETLVLQVAESGREVRRKALLIAPTPPVDAAGQVEAPGNAYEALPEDPFERMRMDPGLARLRRRFFAGVAGVSLLVVAVTVAHFRQGQGSPAQVRTAAPAAPVAERKIQHVRPAYPTLSIEERLERLSGDMTEPADPLAKGEKLAAPVFDLSAADPLTPVEGGAPVVFEVPDRPAVVAPGE